MAFWKSKKQSVPNHSTGMDQSTALVTQSLPISPSASTTDTPLPPLPAPTYVGSEAMMETAFQEALEQQNIIQAETIPAYPAVESMVSRFHGIAQYYLRNGGNSAMFESMIEPALGIAVHRFAPVWIKEPESKRGKDARDCYDLLKALYYEYSYLKETGGKPRPGDPIYSPPEEFHSGNPPGSLFPDLKALGWYQTNDNIPLIEKHFVIQSWFSEHVLFAWQPHEAVMRAYVCDWESQSIPYWAESFGAEILGDNLMLTKRFEDPSALDASQLDDEATTLANSAVSLIRMNVPPSEHQAIYIAPELEPSSPEALILPIISNSSVFGVWGPGQSAEGCFHELARLDPRIRDANIMPNGAGFSDDGSIGWTLLEGPVGSAALSFGLNENQNTNLISFGGPDVNPPYQVALVVGGRTHGALRAIFENCRVVPLESMPGMTLEISEEYAHALTNLGWEQGDEDRSFYFLRREAIVFLMVWNENHYGIFSWAKDFTVAEEPYQIQTVFDRPSLVLTLGRNDPRLAPDQLTLVAEELIRHL